MSSRFPRPVSWAAAILLTAGVAEAAPRELRVCADPNNLPFSNQQGEGFENRIVELIARDLGAELRYTWWAQRRGFIRNTLKARLCDLVPGVPAGMDMLQTTRPYYRSSYVFLTRAGGPQIRTLDDSALRQVRVGVQLIGDDGSNSPPAHVLAQRGIVHNVRGYTVYGNYAEPNPPARIVEAVAAGEVDVAIVWGPLAGYFAARQSRELHVRPVEPRTAAGLPMDFAIAMGVRHGETAFLQEIEAALERRRAEIIAILEGYGVPLVAAATP